MRVVLCWDGGMGSVLALGRLREAGHEVTLLHLADAATRRGLASGVPDFLMEEQAACLGLPLLLAACDEGGEEAAGLAALRGLGPDAVAMGEPGADGPGEKVARAAGVSLLRPLHGRPDAEVAREGMERGFRAFVAACRPPLGPALLGRFLEPALLETLAGASPPEGRPAFETLVVEGPGFARRVDATAGEPQAWRGGWRLDLGLRGC